MPHDWMKIAAGRICVACSLTQAEGEFDDDGGACQGDLPYKLPTLPRTMKPANTRSG